MQGRLRQSTRPLALREGNALCTWSLGQVRHHGQGDPGAFYPRDDPKLAIGLTSTGHERYGFSHMGRICVLTLDPGVAGGVQTKLAAFLRFAESRGHTCDVYYYTHTPRDDSSVRTKEQLRGTLGASAQLYPQPISQLLPHFARSAILARRCRFPVAYDAYQLISGGLDLGLPLVRTKRKFVAWVAGVIQDELDAMPRVKLRHYYFYNPVTRMLTRRQEVLSGAKAECVVVDSTYAAERTHAALGLPSDKIKVFPAPIDTDLFRPARPRTEPHPYILSVARMERRKDFPTLLRAFAMILRRVGKVQLRIVGDGPERAVLESLCATLGIQDHVVFTGEVSQPRLLEEYRGASVFVLASRQEGIGIVFLEALASGIPIVATDSGGSRDPVVGGETGFLVPVGDFEGLANKAVQLLNDRDLARRLALNARQKAIGEYSLDVIYTKLDSIYRQVFDLNPSVSPPVNDAIPSS